MPIKDLTIIQLYCKVFDAYATRGDLGNLQSSFEQLTVLSQRYFGHKNVRRSGYFYSLHFFTFATSNNDDNPNLMSQCILLWIITSEFCSIIQLNKTPETKMAVVVSIFTKILFKTE